MADQIPDLGAIRAAQEQASAMLAMMLQQTLEDPSRIVRLRVSKLGLFDQDDGEKVLLIAQPNGERIDVVLSADTVRDLRRALTDPGQNGGG